MTTTVERTPNGIIYKSAEHRGLPGLDLLTFLFDSKWGASKEDTLMHVDADHPHRAINKAQLRSLVKKTAHTLRYGFGIGQNGREKDVVMCMSTGHWLVSNMFYATVAAGGIFSGASPASTAKELSSQIKQVSSTLLLCNEDTKDIAVAAAKLIGFPLSRVLMLGSGDSLELFEMERNRSVPISPRELDWERITDEQALENGVVAILFSSGTTGLPKGIKLSHTNMVTEASLVNEPMLEYDERFNPGYQPRTLAHLPVAHIAGVQGYCVSSFYFGSTVYWMSRFDFAKFLEYNKKYRITTFFSVPPIYLLLAKSPLVKDQFDSIVRVLSGAAPLGKDLQLEAQKKLGKGVIQLSQTWGLSETTGMITSLPLDMTDVTGSVGSLVANASARLVDDDGKDVEPGQRGELWVKGPMVVKGYWKNEKADKETYVDGWLCTGDIGYFAKGLFYIVDRKKELIKYKGLQVAPAELEALLVTHPKILDAAVIGVPGEGTEVPRAYIVADQSKVTGDEIIQWVASQVGNHKKLRGGVVFLPAIPKSPAGKILRKELRELVKNEKASKI